MEEHFEKSRIQPWNTQEPRIEKNYRRSQFYSNHIGPFFKDFHEWLAELSNNERGFDPFVLESEDLHLLIRDKPLSRGRIFSAISYDDFESSLNPLAKNAAFGSSEKKMMDIFYKTTEKLVADKKKYDLPG
jgi:hypothetical protein